MRTTFGLLLFLGTFLPVWAQSRPVIPATMVIETRELMALQDSLRLQRLARREAEHQRDSLLVVIQNRPSATSEPAPAPSAASEEWSAAPESFAVERVHENALKSATVDAPRATEEPPTPIEMPLPTYWIVVAGSPNEDEAQRMAQAYSHPPFQAKTVRAPNGIYRVCWEPFTDEKTALDVLREARKIRSDAWFWKQNP